MVKAVGIRDMAKGIRAKWSLTLKTKSCYLFLGPHFFAPKIFGLKILLDQKCFGIDLLDIISF